MADAISVGEQIRLMLGLEKFKHVYYQQIRHIPTHLYIVSFDSRRPHIPITHNRLVNSLSAYPRRVKKTSYTVVKQGAFGLTGLALQALQGVPLQLSSQQNTVHFQPIMLSHPKRIEEFNDPLNAQTMFIARDMCSDFYGNPELINVDALEEESIMD